MLRRRRAGRPDRVRAPRRPTGRPPREPAGGKAVVLPARSGPQGPRCRGAATADRPRGRAHLSRPKKGHGFRETEGFSAGIKALVGGTVARGLPPSTPRWPQDLRAAAMTAATSNNAPHQSGGSRYGPTPAAPDSGADRQAAAPEACKETDQWRPTGGPGDHPPAWPPTSQGAPIDPTGTLAVALARLPEVLTVREAAAVLRIGRNQLYQAGGARPAPSGPHRPEHPHPQAGPAGPAHPPQHTRGGRR
jgi:hypothetical protein